MHINLKNFEIIGLHNDMDVNISVEDNKLIIVAENGLGKTTIVNIIYYTLSRQWYKLSDYVFKELRFNINNQTFSIKRDELLSFVKIRKLKGRTIRRNSPRFSRIADYLLNNYNLKDLSNNSNELEEVSQIFDVPVQFVYELLNELIFTSDDLSSNIENITDFLNKNINAQILYLPTYRRIEKDLKNIFPDIETNLDSLRDRRMNYEQEESNKYIELVEFGMEDVQRKVEKKLNTLYFNFTHNLRQSLMGGYLKDILNKNYQKYNYNLLKNISKDQLDEILSRIDKNILSNHEKESLISFIENYKTDSTSISNEDKIVAYFIQKLVDIFEKQSIAEQEVMNFVNICNSYCKNKEFFYSRDKRKIQIFLTEQNKEIDFSKLSSGEKQIVSLFSHLFLSTTKKFFVIIDEPELSLSVSWQERFLTDILNANNIGLIAVTHSPFIFNDELTQYTKGFNEFINYRSK